MKKLLCAVFLAAAVSARGATVFLKGGGRLEGRVVSSSGEAVILDTSQGRVRIPSDRVQSIDYGTAAPAAPPAASPAPREDRERLFEPRNQTLSIGFGLVAPLSDVDFGEIRGGRASNGDVGPFIGFQYFYSQTPRLDWGAEFDYADRTGTTSPGLMPNALSSVSGDTLLFLGLLKYRLTDRGRVRPYALVGAGAHRTSTTIDAQPNPGFVWNDTQTDETRRLVDDSAWGFAMSARLGLDFGFAEPSVFSLEAGWTQLASASDHAAPAGSALGLSGVSGPIRLFTLTARWGWTF